MKEHKYTDHDCDMRLRFAEQTTRFWQETKQKEEGDLPGLEKAHKDGQLQDDRSKQPTSSRS